jgi:hypothetical protein
VVRRRSHRSGGKEEGCERHTDERCVYLEMEGGGMKRRLTENFIVDSYAVEIVRGSSKLSNFCGVLDLKLARTFSFHAPAPYMLRISTCSIASQISSIFKL